MALSFFMGVGVIFNFLALPNLVNKCFLFNDIQKKFQKPKVNPGLETNT